MTGMMPVSPPSAQQRVARMEQQTQQLQADQGTFATLANAESVATKQRMLAIESMIRDREEAIKNVLDSTAAQRATELANVVSGARTEFEALRQSLQAITTAVQEEFQKLQQQVDQSSGREGGSRSGKASCP